MPRGENSPQYQALTIRKVKGGVALARRRDEKANGRQRKPATTPAARENELVSAAHDLAEEQIRTGQASSQVITHFLKLGSSRERLEQERIQHENELLQVKRESLQRADRMESLMLEAVNAMRSYQGDPTAVVDDDDED